MEFETSENTDLDRVRASHDIKRASCETPDHLEEVGSTSPDRGMADDGIWDNESPHSPRNWPRWKRNTQILMASFHSMMGPFMSAGIIPAYDTFVEEYNVTKPTASYLTSFQILLLGISPLIWSPITAVYGRYHVTLLSVLGSMVCNIGGARCASYGAQMATRVLTAFLISPPIGNGSGLVTELCEPEHRAQSLGWWTLMTTIGTPAGPFFMGFVVKDIGVQWTFWIFAIINFCQFLFYLAFSEETVCSRLKKPKPTGFWGKMVPRKISSHSLNPQDIIAPFFLSQYPRILIAAFAHAITFCYGNIVLIVEMPIVFGDKFHFDAEQIGLQFFAIIIGCLLGEQISGPMCDWFLGRVRKSKGHSYPADRLWLSYIGFATVFAGLLTWGFQLQHATTTWNITPCVGAAIASFGNQMQTTILTTFAVESKKEQSSQVGVFVNFCRLVYGFLGPFYFPDMFTTLGLGAASGVMVAIVGGCALCPIIAIHFVATRADRP